MPPCRPSRRRLPAGLLVLALAACGGDDDPTGPIGAELAGTWEAQSGCRPACGFILTAVSDPSRSLDLTAIGGRVEVTIQRSGSFSLRFAFGLSADTTFTGTVRTQGSTMVITDSAGAVDSVTYAVSGDLLTLDFDQPVTVVDFDSDNVPDPATARAVLQRR